MRYEYAGLSVDCIATFLGALHHVRPTAIDLCCPAADQATSSSFIASLMEAGRSTAEELADIGALVNSLTLVDSGTAGSRAGKLELVLQKLKTLEGAFVRCHC